MNTEFKNILSASDKDAQYDERAKRLLGHKIILAHILAKTVDEFKGMHPKDIAGFIEGEPYISIVPVTSGLTNIKTHDDSTCIVGFNTENFEINEGLIKLILYLLVCLMNYRSIMMIMSSIDCWGHCCQMSFRCQKSLALLKVNIIFR